MTASRFMPVLLSGLALVAFASPKEAEPPGKVSPGKQAKARGDLVPLPLKLPKAEPIGTPPKEPPPGVRLKDHRQKLTPRKAFLAPKGVRNVALRTCVTSSDPAPIIGELKLVTDGDKRAAADAFVELGPGVQWVQIDLLKPHKLCAIVVWHQHNDWRVYHDVVIEVADDKDFIRNVRTLFNNDHDNSAGLGLGEDWGYFESNEGRLVDAKGTTARYVRLHSNGSTGDDMNRYAEVEVYGLAAGKAAPAKPAR